MSPPAAVTRIDLDLDLLTFSIYPVCVPSTTSSTCLVKFHPLVCKILC